MMSPRNRVTTPPPPLPLSLSSTTMRNLVARTSRGDFGTRILLPRNLSSTLRSTGRFFISAFDRTSFATSSFLPSFLARQFFTANVDRQRGSASSRPFDRGNVGRNEISFQFFSTFMRLWEGRKLIRRKAEDKAGAAKSAGLVLRSRRTGFQPRRRTIPRGEPRRRCGKGRRGERRERRFLGCTTITAVSYTHVPT